jgi:hypothetical protein
MHFVHRPGYPKCMINLRCMITPKCMITPGG